MPAAAPAADELTALSPKQIQPLLSALAAGLKKAPEEVRTRCQHKISELQAELLKGGQHDDTAVGRLIDDLLTLLPSLGATVLKMFATPLLRSLVGPVTQFVLDKRQKGCDGLARPGCRWNLPRIWNRPQPSVWRVVRRHK